MANIFHYKDVDIDSLQKSEVTYERYFYNTWWNPIRTSLISAGVKNPLPYQISFTDMTTEEMIKEQGQKRSDEEKIKILTVWGFKFLHEIGEMHLLAVSGLVSLPTEWIVRVKGKVPYPVIFNKLDPKSKGEWWWTKGGVTPQDDPFIKHLSNMKFQIGRKELPIERIVDWEKRVGYYDYLKFKWVLQIFPINKDEYIIQFLRDPKFDKWLIIKDLRFVENLEIIKGIINTIERYGFTGDSLLLNPFYPSRTFAVFPDLVEEYAPKRLIEDQREIMSSEIEPEGERKAPSLDDPLDIAKRRLALGEISESEYKNIRRLLK